MKFKKILAIALAAVMTAAALMIPASAASIADTAKSKKSGESFSIKLNTTDYHDYKIKLTKSGSLKISLTSAAERTRINVLDADGNKVLPNSNACKDTTGNSYKDTFNNNVYCTWNGTMEKYKGTIVYELEKGTYYIRIWRQDYYSYSGTGKATIKFTFPGESAESDDSSDAKSSGASAIQVVLEEDDSLTLTTTGSGTVKWSSSDESVATVSSKGKVRAKSAGTATITAKIGSSTEKIQIKVVQDD